MKIIAEIIDQSIVIISATFNDLLTINMTVFIMLRLRFMNSNVGQPNRRLVFVHAQDYHLGSTKRQCGSQ